MIVLSASWIAVVLLSSLRDYRGVVLGFLLGYSLSVGGALLLRPLGLVGLLAGFLFGQVALLIAMVGLITRRFPSKTLVSFEFLDRRRAYFTLAATGFLYNLGIWIDKLLFWFTPSTSEPVLGPLRASIIYDIPIFLAYCRSCPEWRCSWCASRRRSPSSTMASSPRSATASRSPTSAAGEIDSSSGEASVSTSSRSRGSPCLSCSWPRRACSRPLAARRSTCNFFSVTSPVSRCRSDDRHVQRLCTSTSAEHAGAGRDLRGAERGADGGDSAPGRPFYGYGSRCQRHCPASSGFSSRRRRWIGWRPTRSLRVE